MSPTLRRRLAAILALVALVAMLALALVLLVDHIGNLLAAWAALLIGCVGGWFMVTRRGVARLIGTLVLSRRALRSAVRASILANTGR